VEKQEESQEDRIVSVPRFEFVISRVAERMVRLQAAVNILIL
jgi:hypothetical protein